MTDKQFPNVFLGVFFTQSHEIFLIVRNWAGFQNSNLPTHKTNHQQEPKFHWYQSIRGVNKCNPISETQQNSPKSKENILHHLSKSVIERNPVTILLSVHKNSVAVEQQRRWKSLRRRRRGGRSRADYSPPIAQFNATRRK